jgi:hypothetical protein
VRVLRFRHPRHRQALIALSLLLAVALLLLAAGWSVADYRQNVAVNVGADLIGAIFTLFVITPLISRIDKERVREHSRPDYARYANLVAGATSRVRILDTFSDLLDGPFTQRFLRALAQALRREATVHILLLDPSSLAAAQPTREVRTPEAQQEIMRNLRTLHEFEQHILESALRGSFEVRLYSAAPSITLYQWDDKVLASFLPVGELSGRSAPLEVSVVSPFGEFLAQRFAELWSGARPLDQFMRMRVTLLDPAGGNRQFQTEYIDTEDGRYLVDPRLMAHLARRRAASLACCADNTAVMYDVSVVEDDDRILNAALTEHFRRKYGHRHEAFIRLRRRVGASGERNVNR